MGLALRSATNVFEQWNPEALQDVEAEIDEIEALVEMPVRRNSRQLGREDSAGNADGREVLAGRAVGDPKTAAPRPATP